LAKVPTASTKAVKQEVLGYTHLETLAHIDRRAPGMLDTDGIRRPGIQRLGDVLSKQETRFSPKHEAAELAPAERAYLEQSRQHVAGKHAAGGIGTPIVTCVGGAQVGINFVMRRGNFELRVAPKGVSRQEKALPRLGWRLLGLEKRTKAGYNASK